jgi:hypothetical protein
MAGRSTGSLDSMNSEPRYTPKAVAMSRWYLRGFGLMLLVAGALWVAFGNVFQLLGGASLAIAGLAVTVISMASNSNVPSDTAREIVETWVDGE